MGLVIVTSVIMFPEVDMGSYEVELSSPSNVRGSQDPNAASLSSSSSDNYISSDPEESSSRGLSSGIAITLAIPLP